MRFFAGGNTAGGFFSRFEDVLPKERQKRTFYLKGGPGVGKSSLMKAVGQAAEKTGLKTEYFYCSSDPDSLDGVALPEQGAALMDGTAPHVYDPAIPGARDSLVSLGDYLNEEALRPSLEELKTIQAELSERFRRCYGYLNAAAAVRRAACPGGEDFPRMRAILKEWGDALPLRGGEGRLRRLFASAFTPSGFVTRTEFPADTRRFLVRCPLGCYPDELLKRLGDLAASRGLDRIELLDPLEPRHTQSVFLPEYGLLFGAAGPRDEDALPAEKLFALRPREDESFDRNAYELLLQRAVEMLAAAKGLHDRLEAPYIRQMDFVRWEEKRDWILSELGIG